MYSNARRVAAFDISSIPSKPPAPSAACRDIAQQPGRHDIRGRRE